MHLCVRSGGKVYREKHRDDSWIIGQDTLHVSQNENANIILQCHFFYADRPCVTALPNDSNVSSKFALLRRPVFYYTNWPWLSCSLLGCSVFPVSTYVSRPCPFVTLYFYCNYDCRQVICGYAENMHCLSGIKHMFKCPQICISHVFQNSFFPVDFCFSVTWLVMFRFETDMVFG